MNHKYFVFDTSEMEDITIRNDKRPYCRRCGEQLLDKQIKESLLKKIRGRK